MRISHICPFVGEQMGGSERYVSSISKMQSKEHDVHVYTTTLYPKRVGINEVDGVTYHRFYSPLVIWNINPLCFMLRDLLKSDTDIFHIHSHLYTLSNQAIIAKLTTHRKALLQLHGGMGNVPYRTSWSHHAAKLVYDRTVGKFTIENSDIVASVSRSDLSYVGCHFNIPEHRLRYVPNAVNAKVFKPGGSSKESSVTTLLYLGDLEAWKGVGSLVHWISRMEPWEGRRLKFQFVGQGSYLPHLLALQKKVNSACNSIEVEVLGPINHSNVPDIIRKASALILPSYWEGMPTVVLEAMASGTVTICTRVGDIPKVIQHLSTGLLINRSSIDFQKALSTILFDMNNVKRITENARKLVEQEFSLDKVNLILNDLYLEISG